LKITDIVKNGLFLTQVPVNRSTRIPLFLTRLKCMVSTPAWLETCEAMGDALMWHDIPSKGKTYCHSLRYIQSVRLSQDTVS